MDESPVIAEFMMLNVQRLSPDPFLSGFPVCLTGFELSVCATTRAALRSAPIRKKVARTGCLRADGTISCGKS